MQTKRVIDLKNVSVYLGDGSNKRCGENDLILSNVNLAVEEGELVYLIGRVGTGKSTLLKLMYGEVDLAGGEAEVVGFDLRKLKRSQIPYLRRAMGIVFQDFQLLKDRNVFFNLYDVMRATGWSNDDDIRARIDEVLRLVGLEAKCYKMPFELSGGEQQRVVIARAMLNKPALLLADEPTGNLDNENGHKIMRLLHTICKEDGTAVLMITHNEQWLNAYPARVFYCGKGKLIEKDTVSENETVEEISE